MAGSRPPSGRSSIGNRVRTHSTGSSNRAAVEAAAAVAAVDTSKKLPGGGPGKSTHSSPRALPTRGSQGTGVYQDCGDSHISQSSERAYLRAMIAAAEPLTCKRREDALFVRDLGQKLFSLKSQEALRSFFRKADLDNSGYLTIEEFKRILDERNMGVSDEQFARLVKAIDTDQNNEICFEEFQTYFDTFDPLMPPESRYLEEWQKTQTEDNTMTVKPYATAVPGVEHFKNAVKNLFHRKPDVKGKPGSYEQRKEDLKLLKQISQKLYQKEVIARNVFRKFDVDKNGTICGEELQKGLGYMGLHIQDEERDRLMKYIDVDGSGDVNYMEFLEAFINIDERIYNARVVGEHLNENPAYNEEFIRTPAMIEMDKTWFVKTFREKMLQKRAQTINSMRKFDVNGDGNLSAEEIRMAMREVVPEATPEDVDKFLAAYDTSGDGHLQFDEFFRVFDGGEDDRCLGRPLGRTGYFYGNAACPGGPMKFDPEKAAAVRAQIRRHPAGAAAGPGGTIAHRDTRGPPRPPRSQSAGPGRRGVTGVTPISRSSQGGGGVGDSFSSSSLCSSGPRRPKSAFGPSKSQLPAPVSPRSLQQGAPVNGNTSGNGSGSSPCSPPGPAKPRATSARAAPKIRPASASSASSVCSATSPPSASCSRPPPPPSPPHHHHHPASQAEPSAEPPSASTSTSRALAAPAPFRQLHNSASLLSSKELHGRHAWTPQPHDTKYLTGSGPGCPGYLDDHTRLAWGGKGRNQALRNMQLEDRNFVLRRGEARASRKGAAEQMVQARARADDTRVDSNDRDRLGSLAIQKRKYVERMRLYEVSTLKPTTVRTKMNIFQNKE